MNTAHNTIGCIYFFIVSMGVFYSPAQLVAAERNTIPAYYIFYQTDSFPYFGVTKGEIVIKREFVSGIYKNSRKRNYKYPINNSDLSGSMGYDFQDRSFFSHDNEECGHGRFKLNNLSKESHRVLGIKKEIKYTDEEGDKYKFRPDKFDGFIWKNQHSGFYFGKSGSITEEYGRKNCSKWIYVPHTIKNGTVSNPSTFCYGFKVRAHLANYSVSREHININPFCPTRGSVPSEFQIVKRTKITKKKFGRELEKEAFDILNKTTLGLAISREGAENLVDYFYRHGVIKDLSQSISIKEAHSKIPINKKSPKRLSSFMRE
ncbi:MAG: hypothetical protein JAY74_21875 [Candidatus Thiodiazotropha taylori]|nr:hypothetical protein [Candidatus Thiodiazotropha taylori]